VTRLVVLVEFRVKPEAQGDFHRLMMDNAAKSLEREPGCHQFDVLVKEGAADGRYVLYEIYEDAAAFQAHLQSDHYLRFDQAVSPMVLEKKVERLGFAAPASA
jgi:quinol monooxygenase YgiN